MSPKVSVIISSYNYARYLREAVESVIRQSLADWEAIIIDDASTDESAQVMQGFTDPRIVKVYHTENMGNIATYNEGLALAHGEFLANLASDDRYHPDFFRNTVAMLEAHPEAGMAYTKWELIDTDGRFVRRVNTIPHRTDGVHDELRHLVLSCYIAHHSVVMRRSVHKAVGGYTLRCVGDWDLWIRIARRYPIAFVNQSLYQYRRHGHNMSVRPETLIMTEQEMELMLAQLFSDPSLPPNIRVLEAKSKAWQQWSAARLRFMRRDWEGGFRALRRAVVGDATVAGHPRRLVGMTLAILQGLSGRAWSGV